MLVLVVYVHLKPYKPQYNWINVLDAVLLSNLSLIAILSSGKVFGVLFVIRKALFAQLKTVCNSGDCHSVFNIT